MNDGHDEIFGELGEVIIKFKAGKIAGIITKCEFDEAEGGMSQEMEYMSQETEYTLTYGGQSVTLPAAFVAAE